MKILQLNLNHCEAAQDLLMQTTRELRIDLVLIAEPYKHLTAPPKLSSGPVANFLSRVSSITERLA